MAVDLIDRHVAPARIPSVAWRWPMDQPCPDVGHPRVSYPMIDDGEWNGVPIGGLGTRAWQTFEPAEFGIGLVGEQLSPVIGGDLDSSALPVGAFEWWVENPGAEPLTVGILLTWQDPASDPREPAPDGAWHETIDFPRAGGVALHAPAGAPPGLRGTFAIAASRAPGVTISTRSRFDAHADTELLEDRAGNYRASLYLRPLAIWAIEEAIERSHAGAS